MSREIRLPRVIYVTNLAITCFRLVEQYVTFSLVRFLVLSGPVLDIGYIMNAKSTLSRPHIGLPVRLVASC